VPSLLDVVDADPPFWPRVVDKVNYAVSQVPQGQLLFLVAHSNGGLFVPVIAAGTSSTSPATICTNSSTPETLTARIVAMTEWWGLSAN
jgi:hypothetical protein